MDMNYRGECGREGVGRMEWSDGGKWDNCNSIINKYILKKRTFNRCLLEMLNGGMFTQKLHTIVIGGNKYFRIVRLLDTYSIKPYFWLLSNFTGTVLHRII